MLSWLHQPNACEWNVFAIWYGNRVRVVEFQYNESEDEYGGFYDSEMVDDKLFESAYCDVKLVGDQ